MTSFVPRAPYAHELPFATQLQAGLGVATVLPDMDFETYSEAGFRWDETDQKWRGLEGTSGTTKGLGVVGVRPYVEHESFEILSLKYDLKDGAGVHHWLPWMPPPAPLLSYLQNGGLIEAWNVPFERTVWEVHCVRRLGWPAVEPRQWRCAMAKARASGYPGKLSEAGRVMGLRIQKDSEGDRLLKVFSIPRTPTKKDPRRRIRPLDDLPTFGNGSPTGEAEHRDTQALYRYNEVDIQAEAEASSRCADLTGEELEFWFVDQAVNFRGVQVDREGVENCIAILQQAHAKYNAELSALTGIDAASKVQQLLGWLKGQGVFLDSLDEETVESTLKANTLTPIVRRVLEIRAAIGSASVKKVFAMRNRMSRAGRMHDMFQYHATRTGRVTGEGAQPTNMPKAGPDLTLCGRMEKGEFVAGSGCGHHHDFNLPTCPWCGVANPGVADPVEWNPTAAEDALTVIASRSLAAVEYFFGSGNAMHVIAGCLRGLYVAAPGHDLISSDFSSIEAVVLAVLAGEQWRLDVFRTHGKIYETSASTMYDVPFSEFLEYKKRTGQHHPLRAKGKIGELAFGYQGWIGAAKQFGMPGTDEEIAEDILRWRKASPNVEWFWGGQTRGKANGPVVNDSRPPLSVNWRGEPDRWDRTPYYFGAEGMAVLAISNPGESYEITRMDGSGSGVSYRVVDDVLYCTLPSGRSIAYHRPRLRESERGGCSISFESWNTNPKNGPMGWIRMDTWGGRLVENIVQATARDILRHAMVNLERFGYPIVLHVYDEIVSEVLEGVGTVEQLEAIMASMPVWAAGWPIKAAGGWRAKRYRKG